jgi:hypothetical protein
MYQRAFESSQLALVESRSNAALNSELRQDLESYVTSLNLKTDSEGHRLLAVPRNFETVSSAMTRADLFDSTANSNQWSYHLLSQGFGTGTAAEGGYFEGGRYKDILNQHSSSQEQKLQLGLAEMHLLDAQVRISQVSLSCRTLKH